MSPVQTAHDLVEAESAHHHVGNRTHSTALLAWFLEAVWRLDPAEISDSICDGGGDKGIDAIVVDHDAREIVLFQAKHRIKASSTQGDKDLKQFVGVAHFFADADGVDALMDSKPNAELSNLIARLEIRKLLAESDFHVKLAFVTNVRLDAAGSSYSASARAQHDLDVWDLDRISHVAERTRTLQPLGVTRVIPLSSDAIYQELSSRVKLTVALIAATELVRLPGIDDHSIFDLNVRLSLGRTNVNKDLVTTIKQPSEHQNFPAFHNGLTLIANKVEVAGREMTIEGISVVNGCQSLVALFTHSASLTPDLTVLVKVVEIGTAQDLADEITYRANNQNSINRRDLRSTDSAQRDLRSQMEEAYGSELTYVIRSGQPVTSAGALDNQTAAQFVLASLLGEPWNAVRKVRLFDQEYHRIFSRRLTAHHLYMLYQLDKWTSAHRSELRSDLEASYASVRFTLLYLLTELLRFFPLGAEFLDSPERWLPDKRSEIKAVVDDLMSEIIDDLNDHIETRLEEAAEAETLFDPKTIFKSKSGVGAVAQGMLRQAKRTARKDADFGFHVVPARK